MDELVAKSVIVLDWILGSMADVTVKTGPVWEIVKLSFIVPLLRICLYICLVMSFLLSAEWVHLVVVTLFVKIFWKKPEDRYKWEAMQDDLENGNADFPMVLVQIPIANELEVYKLSIGAACNLSWPADRLVIQILDDSTDIVIKDMIEKECLRWAGESINIRYQMRETRVGYKAGALKQGMEQEYVKECEYVAIFDADFQPEPDFLRRTIPFLVHNPELGLVQARWSFVNADECLLTRLQEMSLDFHFRLEQEVGSSTHSFFGFNGSGGIWRIEAINEAGGWDGRTTAEDMDLAVRAGLKTWKFLYLGQLRIKSELPSTFKAYRSQQHRWFCGPANLFKKTVIEIAKNKKISLWKKLYMICSFFFVRKIIGHTCVFLFYCVVLPLTILIPEVNVPKGGAVYVPCIITALNTLVSTPRSLYLILHWILFETSMSYHRTKAVVIGLFGAKGVNEWIVTEKLGGTLKDKANNIESIAPKEATRFEDLKDRILLPELGIAMFLFICGCYGFFYGKDYYFVYVFIQVIFFILVGFSYFGTMRQSCPSS